MSDTSPRFQSHVKVGVCVLLVGIAMAMVQCKVPTIMLSIMTMFNMDAATASWLMSIFVFMMIPLAIPAGIATAKLGARKVIAAATVLIVAASIVGAFASSVPVLMATRAAEGIAVTVLTVAAPVLIGQCVAPEKSGSALGFWGVWGPLGSAFAALATPSVFEATSFQGLWLSYAVIVIAAAVIMFVAVKAPVPAAAQETQDAREAADSNAGQAESAPKIRDVFCRDTVLFFFGFIGFNVVMLAVLSYVPTILQNKGMNPTMSGFASTLPMILSAFSSPFFGALLDKTGKTKLLLVVTVAFLGPCALVLYTQTGTPMWAAAIVMGLIGMGSSGLLIAAFMRVLPDPHLASVGMGVMITVQGIGQFIGSAVVQALLGPQLDQLVLAGVVVMVIDLIGAACMAAAHYR